MLCGIDNVGQDKCVLLSKKFVFGVKFVRKWNEMDSHFTCAIVSSYDTTDFPCLISQEPFVFKIRLSNIHSSVWKVIHVSIVPKTKTIFTIILVTKSSNTIQVSIVWINCATAAGLEVSPVWNRNKMWGMPTNCAQSTHVSRPLVPYFGYNSMKTHNSVTIKRDLLHN